MKAKSKPSESGQSNRRGGFRLAAVLLLTLGGASGCQSVPTTDGMVAFGQGTRPDFMAVRALGFAKNRDEIIPPGKLPPVRKSGAVRSNDAPETTVFQGRREAVPDPKEL